MTDTNPRDLIRRLTVELDFLHCCYNVPDQSALIAEARDYLDQSVPDEPTDEEILALSQWHEVSYTLTNGNVIYPLQEGTDMKDAVLSFTRAVLARWGK